MNRRRKKKLGLRPFSFSSLDFIYRLFHRRLSFFSVFLGISDTIDASEMQSTNPIREPAGFSPKNFVHSLD
jgi:hypothetical protein